ncbi:crossover junction endodeoxyribonuclease RuvC [Candidatus Wolfebacteria bacterium RIFCSPHIGHO2_01_FULL_48_22]|uniref:Crossover junction endodeoxyribonuclease RuvC n=2 Tax=Candidatus Wolfeibacteriota TaxID=1752735 RepID=A0A1F8DS24_9BACT|nr:MAG: crossover junction endodeoxyribonuclease RuvC [Candidatus Wolfebacteria bacterium RIFCSPHIGHO2_01_FULL_48_22]OGM92118.1 MAG: crossover junction endodeoxyribonuclease RuvC [Candidatus Wolfebacteria bacterium RIFCSPLOWO2_01_FULL_47_17b]
MIFLGIDPGSTRAGYGIVRKDGNAFSYVACGILSTSFKDKNDLLTELYSSIQLLIKKYKPSAAGIEKLFFVKNMKTGLEVAQSRGVVILSLRQHNIPVYEYTPKEIKQWLTGSGVADKKAMIRLVRSSLVMPGDIKEPDDAYDALAIALITGYTSVRGDLVVATQPLQKQ